MNFKDWLIESTILLEIDKKTATSMDDLYSNTEDYAFKSMFDKAVPDNDEATRFVVQLENDPVGVSILNNRIDKIYDKLIHMWNRCFFQLN